MSGVPVETGADHTHAHPPHTGSRWFDTVAAVSAIFISGVSLAVAIEHGRTERDLVAANSWPFLRATVTNQAEGGRAIAIGLSNGGVGPAKVKTFEMALDGAWLGSPGELLRRCCGLPADTPGIRRALPNGLSLSQADETVLRPGEENDVLIAPKVASAPELTNRLDAVLTRLTFHVCYCSALDQCWTSDLKTTDTPVMKSCPAPAHPYRYNQVP